MKVVVLYRPQSEHARQVETFIRDFQARHDSSKLQVVNIDSQEGSATAAIYEVMQYPAILAVRNDGSILKDWQGNALPLMDEVAYYTFSLDT